MPQKAVRKCVEGMFVVLKGRFSIVDHPSRPRYREYMQLFVKKCVIVNNMAVEVRKCDYLYGCFGGLRGIQERNILSTSWRDLNNVTWGGETAVRSDRSPDDHYR